MNGVFYFIYFFIPTKFIRYSCWHFFSSSGSFSVENNRTKKIKNSSELFWMPTLEIQKWNLPKESLMDFKISFLCIMYWVLSYFLRIYFLSWFKLCGFLFNNWERWLATGWLDYWTDLNWIELNWNELKWNELKWNELKWTDLKWKELNWTELNWNELNELKWINWIKLN